jgi:hypothetical protein
MDWAPIPTGKRTAATGWVVVTQQRWQAVAVPPGAPSSAGLRIGRVAEVRRVVGGSPNILDTGKE